MLLGLALGVWWARGRPVLPLDGARRAAREIASDPLTGAFLVAVVVLLGYELLLVLTDPPNNTDSLTYHLPRVAAWVQHGGVYWIPNAPTDRLNEFQPLAEREIFFLFVATGKGALFALEATTAQNDLVWNPWETRFLVVPAALTAPLLAAWFRSGPAALSALVAATLYGVLALVQDVRKPLAAPVGRPWDLSWVSALSSSEGAGTGPAVAAYQRLVPPRACVGAVLAPDEQSYPLYCPKLEHRVSYLPVDDAVFQALRNQLSYVVVGTGPNRFVARDFATAGWKLRRLASSYLLVVSPARGARARDCV
jgi:hypothetical protein